MTNCIILTHDGVAEHSTLLNSDFHTATDRNCTLTSESHLHFYPHHHLHQSSDHRSPFHHHDPSYVQPIHLHPNSDRPHPHQLKTRPLPSRSPTTLAFIFSPDRVLHSLDPIRHEVLRSSVGTWLDTASQGSSWV